MSLSLLLDDDGLTDLFTTWPDDPRVYHRGSSDLDQVINREIIEEYIATGCVPAAEIAVLKAGPSINPLSFMRNGRTDPAKLRKLRAEGFTIRLGNLQRVIPGVARIVSDIQRETGFSNYVTAFVTPAGNQGLLHHWDQQMGVIVQLAGTKIWDLWRPVVPAPMRAYNESFRVWRDDYIPTWRASGPDLSIELTAGQSLVLPRGWVHNPNALDLDEESVHLTFAIRERTPYWIAEQILALALDDPAFRGIIRPADVVGEALGNWAENTQLMLAEHLRKLDLDELTPRLLKAALTEQECTD